jgi:hypothetical protein
MKTIFFSAATAALLLASPALASPQEDAACVIARLSAADVSVIVDDSMAGGSDAILGRITGPLAACAEGRDWSADRRANAAAYTIGIVVRGVLHDRLGAQGIDTAALDRWFARQSVEFRTTAFTTMSEADLGAALGTLAGHEVPADAMERYAPMIGGYMSALMIIERIERGLGM